MATCKDCICYSGCSGILNDFGMRLNPAREVCDRFEDRSRFVELPSDGVMYGVLNGKPIELPNYISPPKGKELFIISPETVNVPFFKSKEEAEQALKEREGNG